MNKTELLKNILKQKNISIRKLSQKTNIPYTTLLTVFQNGIETTNFNNITKICNALNINIDILNNETITFTNKPSTIVVIGRGGEKVEYEVPDEELDFAKEFIEKMSKKK